jgi:integrase/recombinase XerD
MSFFALKKTGNKNREAYIVLLSEAWDLYFADKTIERYSTTTLKGYKLQTKLLIRHFGDIDIRNISLLDLKNYLIEKCSHLKPSSMGMRIRYLRAFLHWASDEGHIEKNPASKLREPRLGKHLPKALGEEDMEMLRESCKTSMEHALIEFLYTTGSRVGEVTSLNRNDIDWDDKSCIVLGKGDKERRIYFNMKCFIWLRKYVNERTDNDGALFVTERAPHRLSIEMIRYIVKRVAKRAKIEVAMYPHIMRHSYATHLLNNGAPLEGIQTLLGHANIDTTRIYADLSGPRRKEIYKRYF